MRPKTITHEGKTHTLAEWSKLTGIPLNTIMCREREGRKASEILSKTRLAKPPNMTRKPRRPVKDPKTYTRMSPITVDGVTHTVDQWAYDLNMPVAVMLARLKTGDERPEQIIRKGLLLVASQGNASRPNRATGPTAFMRVPTLAEVDAMRRAA